MQFLYWLSLLALPGLPFWATSAMGSTPPEAGMARALFCLAAVWATVVGMAWLCNEPHPAWLRVSAGVLIGAYVFVGLPQSLGWVRTRESVVVAPKPFTPPAHAPAQVALANRAEHPVATRPPTFREMFEHDFPTLPYLARNVGLESAKTGEKTQVPVHLLVELGSREKFLSVFIERNTSSFNTCVFFLYNVELVFQQMNAVALEENVPRATPPLFAKDFAFDHNIYFYMAEDMSMEAQSYLQKAFRDQGMAIHFRGAAYYAMHVHDAVFEQPVTSGL